MTRSFLSLRLAKVTLSISGPDVWLTPLQHAWAKWVIPPRLNSWQAEIRVDDSLSRPTAPLFEAIPRCLGGLCRMTAPGFRAEINARDGVSHLYAHPQAQPADIGYFLRVTLALQVFAQGGILFHAAGIVHHGQGYGFFGNSGSGKTTAAQLSRPDPVLNDDLIVLWPEGNGWLMYATPFGKRRGKLKKAHLRALLRLIQDTKVSLEPFSTGRALAELIANTPVISGDRQWLPQAFSRWETVLQHVPIYGLHFRKDPTFWEVINGTLG